MFPTETCFTGRTSVLLETRRRDPLRSRRSPCTYKSPSPRLLLSFVCVGVFFTKLEYSPVPPGSTQDRDRRGPNVGTDPGEGRERDQRDWSHEASHLLSTDTVTGSRVSRVCVPQDCHTRDVSPVVGTVGRPVETLVQVSLTRESEVRDVTILN